MIDEQWRAAWNVYESACELPYGERRAFVESELDDPAVRRKVLTLLERPDGQGTSEFPRDATGSEVAGESESGSLQPTLDDWPHLGKTIGRFVVAAPLGRGGMGVVYAARDMELHRSVALKFLSAASIGTGGVDRFIREAQSASALNHPGIVTVHEVIRFESSVAIVMELVEGSSFRTLCGKPNAPERVADWGRQMSQALAVAHAHNIVHRDVKPDNLMLRDDNLVKILDFGIARDIASPQALETIPLGTLGYMSPEQLSCGVVTSAADVFSLGVILFELANGSHPFLADTASETTRAIALLDPGPLRIPAASRVGQKDLDALIRSMLAKNPSERPDAATVARKLDQVARRFESIRYKRVLRVAIPVLVAGLAAIAWWVTGRRTDSSLSPPQITQFTSLEGREEQPSFSPDGRKIAFVWDGADGVNRDIYTQEIAEAPVRLTTDAAEDTNPMWSPDGKEIAFLRRVPGDSRYTVLIMDANGGGARRVGSILELEYFHGVLAWWPDGKSLIVRDESAGTVGFVRLFPATGEKRPLTTPSGTDRDSDVTVSPDSGRIAFVRRGGATLHDSLCLQELAGGTAECFPTASHSGSVAWWHKGTELLYTDAGTIWRVTAGHAISHDRTRVIDGDYGDLAADRAGRRLVAARGNVDTNLWRVGRHGEGRVKLISSTMEESDAQYSPDGEQIVFRSNRLGSFDLWVARKDGSKPTRITKFSGRMGSARWSPDGRFIAFDGYASPFHPAKNTNVYVVSSSGGPIRRLTDEATLYFVPNWSNDGLWIYYVKQNGTHWETWKVRFQGGDLVKVSDDGMFDLVESVDGRYFYYTTQRGAPGVWRRPVEGGQGVLVAGTQKVGLYRYWQLSPSGLYFAEGPANPLVQFLNLKTGAITHLASLGSQLRRGPRGLAVSPDGLSFVYMQEDSKQSDLYLLDGIQ